MEVEYIGIINIFYTITIQHQFWSSNLEPQKEFD